VVLLMAAGCGSQLVEFGNNPTDASIGIPDTATTDASSAIDGVSPPDARLIDSPVTIDGATIDGTTIDGTTIDGGILVSPINLRSLATFVAVAGAGLTNSNSAGVTVLGGDVGLSPTATCLSDGLPCNPPAGAPTITGTLYAADPGGIAAQAKADLVLAYVEATGKPPGTLEADLSGLILVPGTYTSASTMMIAVNGTLTLDGGGDSNASWIFQIGSALTVNNGAQVLLINGAKAANVFWAIGSSSTLGSGVHFKGTVLAQSSNSVGTGSTVEGRLLCTTGQITLLSNTITLPAP
jgi:hypothetical protein